jgi:phage tail sheath protein FI
LNQALLSEDAIDMIENRADAVYVLTTPDKPWGAKDEAIEDMYSSSDAASNLEDTNVNTFYGVTYYPWVRYFDRENNIYLNLPPTKDVVRNMANTDNKRYPWIASAGVERGTVECAKLHFPAKLDDRDNVYDNRINPLMTFPEGVKIWGNKSLYICDETDPLNRINAVRLLIYMRKLISEAVIGLVFEPNDATLRQEFEGIIRPILSQIKADRGITNYELETSQTPEQMDAHEISAKLWVWPTPTLEYIEIEFVVAPQGVQFNIG